MKSSHTTPEEAFKIFNDLNGELLIPMHYGTYDLSDEPLGEPIKRFDACFNNEKDSKKQQKLAVGEVYLIK